MPSRDHHRLGAVLVDRHARVLDQQVLQGRGLHVHGPGGREARWGCDEPGLFYARARQGRRGGRPGYPQCERMM